MERKELIRLLVLNAICDDYENVDQIILPTVVRDAAECGAEMVDRSEIVDALADLVASGLADAFTLSPCKPFSVCITGMPPLDMIEEDFKTYFFITERGMALHLSNNVWPLKLDEPA